MHNGILQIIMYHYVRNLPQSRYPQIRGLLLDQFVQQLRFLKDAGYSFISIQQILEAAGGGGTLPQKSVLLTFDDGYIDHYTNVFPLLDAERIPAFFSMPGKIIREKKLLDVNRIHFILASTPIEKVVNLLFSELDSYRGTEYQIPDNRTLYNNFAKASRFDDADTIFVKRLLQVELPETLRNAIACKLFEECIGVREESFVEELYLSMEQVKLMQRHGMTWGIHGYEHAWMNRMAPDVLEADIKAALEVFDGILPNEGWLCCYPYGSVSDSVVDCAARLGAIGGMVTEVRNVDLGKDSIFRLPRFDTNDFPPKSDNYLKYM